MPIFLRQPPYRSRPQYNRSAENNRLFGSVFVGVGLVVQLDNDWGGQRKLLYGVEGKLKVVVVI